MGRRKLSIRLRGGTKVKLLANYYHRSATIKKHAGNKGFYPGLLLVGVSGHYSPSLESIICLHATAASSLNEAAILIKESLGFSVDTKTIRDMAKRFGEKARTCYELDAIEFPDDFSGRIVAASTDGGRIRIRKTKRGRKTKKGRNRYSTDWREPKLIIIYVIGENGEKERNVLPIMDATLKGPDAAFGLLIYYLKRLKVNLSDKLLFISDGAKWIWERAKSLAEKVGIDIAQCRFALDYYHAVEHLSKLASEKRWTKEEQVRWVNKQKKRLLKGKLEAFMNEIDTVCKGSKNKRIKRERKYFKTHAEHMKYAELKNEGLPIGSGAVESSIRRVINLRLKGPGIFWHEDTAGSMLIMRSYYKAGRWNLLKNVVFMADVALA